MIIDVRKLNVSGKYSGHLSFEYEAPQELIDIPFVKFAAPVRIEAEYVLFEDDSLELTGTVSYLLTEGKTTEAQKYIHDLLKLL